MAFLHLIPVKEMFNIIGFQSIFLVLIVIPVFSQKTTDLLPISGADSTYVRKFLRKNELRMFYGGQGNNLSIGSTRDKDINVNSDLYNNTNDFIGFGVTYGWLNGDMSFSLPGSTYLKEERSNLTQFKIALGHARRKMVYRMYYIESTGVVLSGSNNEFESTPSIHEVKFGMQITYLFNASKYSYRAAMYQSEYQMKTAGSFLIRFDPFYRKIGANGRRMIPEEYDLVSRFGEQAGLEYINSPGMLVLVGYGLNIVIGDSKFFISPIVSVGIGLAQNRYVTANGTGSFNSTEYGANAVLNAGYNGTKYYAKIFFNWSSGYTTLDPTYLTHSNLNCVITVGRRFKSFKKKLEG
ncbi:MAG: DUF4421 family protein [Reichenbachiella sp.]